MSVERPATPPKLVAQNAIENNEVDDLTFTADEWRNFEQHFKRRLAGAAKSDEISGRDPLLRVRSYFVVQRSLTEYEP
jgi:hypothetical protein